ncbi:MAG: OmpA family protein [Planctomycetota bacterium]
MRRCAPILILLALSASGCGRFVFKPNAQPAADSLQQQVQTLAQQNQEFQSRTSALDQDNQELESLLAQSRQQVQLLTDELTATRGQLKSTTEQVLAFRNDNQQLRTKTSALVASVQKRSRAEIRANNSLLKNLDVSAIPGVEVRQDGDVVRVEIPADQLFLPGSPIVKQGGEQTIQSVAADLRRNFPAQFIGIEGHTDDSPSRSQQYPTNHHLSSAQALAVYTAVVRQRTMPAEQLFVIGHGQNHPIVSNATPNGKTRNRRVEFVVYPESTGQN